MSNPVSEFGRAILRRVSGEHREKNSQAMVGNDANQDGDRTAPNQNKAEGDIHAEGKEQDACFTCQKIWNDIKPKGSHCYLCAFCDKWFCANCAQIKKNEHAGVKRHDVYWACDSCAKTIKAKQLKNLVNNDEKSKPPQLSQLESKLDKLENKIEMAVKKVLPKAVDYISQTLNENFAKQWSEALFGDYDENFPKLGSKPENDTSDQTQQQIKQQTSKQGILQTVVQKAVTTSKHDDLKREERLNNIIIYRVPESQEKNSDTRKAKEKELVDKLLEKIEVAASPEKIVRLGKYREPKDGEALGSRPLKVTFADHQTQQEVMQNLSKLKDASQELKSLSVCYDMSESEREILKEHLRRAKEKTESSSNWRFVVRGPPWNLEEIRLKKRT